MRILRTLLAENPRSPGSSRCSCSLIRSIAEEPHLRHLVVGTPGDVLHLVGDEYGGDVVLLFEDFTGVGGEGGRGVDAWEGVDGCEGESVGHNVVFLRAKVWGD